MMIATKTCNTCFTKKPLDEYYKGGYHTGTERADCIPCARKYNRERYHLRKLKQAA